MNSYTNLENKLALADEMNKVRLWQKDLVLNENQYFIDLKKLSKKLFFVVKTTDFAAKIKANICY